MMGEGVFRGRGGSGLQAGGVLASGRRAPAAHPAPPLRAEGVGGGAAGRAALIHGLGDLGAYLLGDLRRRRRRRSVLHARRVRPVADWGAGGPRCRASEQPRW